MCIRYLGYLLLIWFPGLHAQTTSCPAPELEDGYFLPERKNYFDKEQVTYACNKGSKPDVEGWWATSTCQEGTWHPEPKCIGKDACTSPNIPNAEYKHDNELIIRVTCDKGYIINDSRKATSTCENGTWSSLPVCEESPEACGAPPKIPNAVIINQEYQDMFAADSEVQYECKDGFTVEGADTKKTITCVSSEWSTGPLCSGGSGSAVGGTGGGHTTSAGSGTQPTGGGSGSAVGGTGGGHTTSAGSGTQPTGGGSSTTSDRDSRPLFTTIDNCGDHPSVPHGDVVVTERMYLKYQCQKYYKREGPETVVCHNDGTWSNLPVCKESFCALNPAELAKRGFKLSQVQYMMEGEETYIYCGRDHYSLFRCTNRQISVTACCTGYYHQYGLCST